MVKNNKNCQYTNNKDSNILKNGLAPVNRTRNYLTCDQKLLEATRDRTRIIHKLKISKRPSPYIRSNIKERTENINSLYNPSKNTLKANKNGTVSPTVPFLFVEIIINYIYS